MFHHGGSTRAQVGDLVPISNHGLELRGPCFVGPRGADPGCNGVADRANQDLPVAVARALRTLERQSISIRVVALKLGKELIG